MRGFEKFVLALLMPKDCRKLFQYKVATILSMFSHICLCYAKPLRICVAITARRWELTGGEVAASELTRYNCAVYKIIVTSNNNRVHSGTDKFTVQKLFSCRTISYGLNVECCQGV